MTIEEIRELKEMGFSKEEILAFVKTPEKEEEQKPDDKPEEKVDDEIKVNKIAETFNATFNSFIEEMNKTIDRMNITSAQQPPEPQRGAEQLLADIVMPKTNKKGK